MKKICIVHETFRVKKQVCGPLVRGPNHFLATLLSLSQTLLNSLEPLQGWYLVLVTPLPSLHVPSAVSTLFNFLSHWELLFSLSPLIISPSLSLSPRILSPIFPLHFFTFRTRPKVNKLIMLFLDVRNS